MATVMRENIGTLHDKVTVKLQKEDYLPSFEKSLKDYAKRVNIPGFRKGMVPGNMVRKMYGPSLLSEEVIRSAGRKLEDYLREQNLSIFAQPIIMPEESKGELSMSQPGDLDFSFEIGLKPEFDITPLQQHNTLKRYRVAVNDKLIDDEINRLTRRYGKVEHPDTITGTDDILYCTYQPIDADGNPGSSSDDTILLEKVPEPLRQQLMGKQKDDTVEFTPSEIASGDELQAFLSTSLKHATDPNQRYRLTVTQVGKLIPHALDETLFAQAFPNDEIKDEAQLREKLRQEISKEFDRIASDRLNSEIYETLVHHTPLTLPVPFLKRWMRSNEQEKPRTEEEVEKEFPSFDHQLRWTLISDKLMKDNGINVSREEVLKDIRSQVLGYFGLPAASDDELPEWMDTYMKKIEKEEKTMNETYRRLLFDKLFRHLQTQFTLQDQEITEEEFFKLPDAHTTQHAH